MNVILSSLKKNRTVYRFGIKLSKIIGVMKVNRLKTYDDQKKKKYIAYLYKKRTGQELRWNHLENYTEKMQWAKIYDNTTLKSCLTDKYQVRKWVEELIGSDYLIPLLGVWNSFDEIDFSELPNKFVLKVNNGSGTNIIVKDKSTLDLKIAKAKIDNWMSVDRSFIKGFEMHYTDIQPRIIAEKFIECAGNGDLPDYKFLCFNGQVYYCWVDIGRYHEHKRNVYDLEWNLQPWNQYSYGNYETPIQKPQNFDKMIQIATILCQGFSHVRVDLYNVDGKIYFGEMTFTNGSGFEPILPEKYNRMLGDLWKLDMNDKDAN